MFVLLIGLIAWGVFHLTPPGLGGDLSAGTAPLTIGAPAPDFSAPDLAGQRVQLRTLRGTPVWINFWATWCAPCKTEMPQMEEKYRQYQGQGLVILGVNLQEDPRTVRAWIQNRFGWRFLIDQHLTLANLYDLDGLPGHVFIDRGGIIRGRHSGELDAAQMDAQLAAILPP